MEQMQRGGRQIPNIDSLHSCMVITAQLDDGSCQMGEWHQYEQDLDIKLGCARRELLLLRLQEENSTAKEIAEKHSTNLAVLRRECPCMFFFFACSAL